MLKLLLRKVNVYSGIVLISWLYYYLHQAFQYESRHRPVACYTVNPVSNIQYNITGRKYNGFRCGRM